MSIKYKYAGESKKEVEKDTHMMNYAELLSGKRGDDRLDFWLKHNKNVMFVGRQGVGKTARILESYKRAGLNFRYFSGSTMDPWVDFIGIPRAIENNGRPHVELVLPKEFQDDTIEAIFIDEFNRSHKKVRNAVMELIQFKSINGRRFHKLRVVWVAINPPEEGEFQVEELDEAQTDRFHVQVYVPYKPCTEYFSNKYGPKKARGAISWWNDLSEEDKKLISPRRLDYALEMYLLPDGDLHDVLPVRCNITNLVGLLGSGPAIDRLVELFETNDIEGATKFLGTENSYSTASKYLVKSIPADKNQSNWMGFFLPLLAPEKLSSLIVENEKALNFVLNHVDNHNAFNKVIYDILTADTNRRIIQKIKRVLGTNKTLAAQFANTRGIAAKPHFNKYAPIGQSYTDLLTNLEKGPMGSTIERRKVYGTLLHRIPAVMTTDQAIKTLTLASSIVSHCWSKTVRELPSLMGMINQCIEQIHKNTGLNWGGIVANYGTNFEVLLDKIREANLDDKLYCPTEGNRIKL